MLSIKHFAFKAKTKEMGPRPILCHQGQLPKPSPLLFVIESLQGRGQVLEDTSLRKDIDKHR